MYRIGFDVGGTFTDFTMHDTTSGKLRHFKVPSTPADPSEAIEGGLRTLLDTLRIAPRERRKKRKPLTHFTDFAFAARVV